eukprot:GILJ01008723.1.p1 GENE.GILJ01008723.1~~GILJ01008723.1.p1  ORF type:complete len:359 (+),score=40.90 GILJ01008723.1:3-1079(+)
MGVASLFLVAMFTPDALTGIMKRSPMQEQRMRIQMCASAPQGNFSSVGSVLATAAATGDRHDTSYYAKCMFGGLLACGLTHTAMVPLDIVKCRMQVDPNRYKGIFDGFNKVKAEGGMSGLRLGWLPTFLGYSMQGLAKYGFYELFKDKYSEAVGHENAVKYRTLVYLSASASAELIADVFLCPMESVKVRMQTSAAGNFPTAFGAAAHKIWAGEGMSGFFKGISPLWMRQVPYTMVKFASFERTVEAFYTHIFTKPKDQYSKATQLSVTFMSGYLAGIFCAIVSHPADTVVSKLNQVKTEGSTVSAISGILKDLGPAGVWRGLGPRIIMIGTLTGLQWWIYDTFKSAMGLQTSGGVKK